MRTFLFAAALVALGNAAFAETQPADDLLPAITEVPETNLVEWTLVITSDIYRGGSVDFFPTPFVKLPGLKSEASTAGYPAAARCGFSRA